MINSNITPNSRAFTRFVSYVLQFYGPGQIYDYGFTEAEVIKATKSYLLSSKISFEGDTVDRENVREVVFAQRRKNKAFFNPKLKQVKAYVLRHDFEAITRQGIKRAICSIALNSKPCDIARELIAKGHTVKNHYV
jgi:hypothetical protein